MTVLGEDKGMIMVSGIPICTIFSNEIIPCNFQGVYINNGEWTGNWWPLPNIQNGNISVVIRQGA